MIFRGISHTVLMTVALAALISGCALRHQVADVGPMLKVEGVVIDDVTGKPLQNAFVIQRYHAIATDWPHSIDASDYCYKSVVTKTDALGRFEFPLLEDYWSSWVIREYYQYLLVYRESYYYPVPANDSDAFLPSGQRVEIHNVIKLRPDNRAAVERLEYLRELIGARHSSREALFECNRFSAATDLKHLDVMAAMYTEAEKIAKSEPERDLVVGICEDAMRYFDPVAELYFPQMFPKPCVFDVHRFEKLDELRNKRKEWTKKNVDESGPYDPRDPRFQYDQALD